MVRTEEIPMVSRIYDYFYYGISSTSPTYLVLDFVRDKILDEINHPSDWVQPFLAIKRPFSGSNASSFIHAHKQTLSEHYIIAECVLWHYGWMHADFPDLILHSLLISVLFLQHILAFWFLSFWLHCVYLHAQVYVTPNYHLSSSSVRVKLTADKNKLFSVY